MRCKQGLGCLDGRIKDCQYTRRCYVGRFAAIRTERFLEKTCLSQSELSTRATASCRRSGTFRLA